MQTHGGEIRWRNIWVREIPAKEANELLASKNPEGFQSIFNGKDFTGWRGAVSEYEIEDGSLYCKKGRGNGEVLYTDGSYDDFVVRLMFQLPPAGNNGLAIRYPGEGGAWNDGMCELQILDSEHPKYRDLDVRQYHGSAYGMVPAVRGYLRPQGEWNFQEATVEGPTIKVELDGSIILETDLSEVTETMGGHEHPGRLRSAGHFGFAGHDDPVKFCDISIKELK
ncbi:hypothetical protein Pla144_46220 [Bythopirellula polymerisocia]|uniref:3-keto-alpha-glucoside-1,2-lyase/3-keto-2-hydroxy-glucal hydratase domain-containing protein n=1 Tax=Bythopirellula polymerisocia TaxID=2528003 RepID=A0A5C6CD86_9BACT|nr:hypothetical protein Pla144_46220 [Bythopirellula polymerisocia]